MVRVLDLVCGGAKVFLNKKKLQIMDRLRFA